MPVKSLRNPIDRLTNTGESLGILPKGDDKHPTADPSTRDGSLWPLPGIFSLISIPVGHGQLQDKAALPKAMSMSPAATVPCVMPVGFMIVPPPGMQAYSRRLRFAGS